MGSRGPADRTRRRFVRRRWARRWLAWRYLAALLVLVALVAGGVWLAYFSSWLSVHDVEVVGADQVSETQVRRAAAVPSGQPLVQVDLDRIRSRVQALAAVRSADVSRQWPDQVRIQIDERVAVAVVEIGGRLQGMDEDGVVFRDYAEPPPRLPRVQTGSQTGSEALREAALVVAALPEDLQARVDHVEVTTVDELSLVLRDGRTVEWGSAQDSELKARVLADLITARRAPHYDVSVPSQPTTSR